jgi:hypothetical protein
MARNTFLHDAAKCGKRRPHVIAHTRVLHLDRKSAWGTMHLRADVLHALRHEGRDMSGAM